MKLTSEDLRREFYFGFGGRWMDGCIDGWMGGGGGGISDESEWLVGWHHSSPDGNGCVCWARSE